MRRKRVDLFFTYKKKKKKEKRKTSLKTIGLMNFRIFKGGFGIWYLAESEAKLVSQFMQTKFFCRKNFQNTPIFFPVS